MNLKNYLFAKGITQSAFAERVGVTKYYMCRLINGKLKPGKLLAEKIENLTKGEVKINSWKSSENSNSIDK